MSAGKLSAQAGHAFLNTYLQALEQDPARAQEYIRDLPGTKIVLLSRALPSLLELEEKASWLGIPSALVEDKGHVLLPHFTGAPIVTALGVGPARRSEVRLLTKGLALVP